MKKPLLFLSLGLMAGLLLSASITTPAHIQDNERPGPEHKFLESMVGEFESHNSIWLTPGTKPMMAEGKSTSKMIMDGRFLFSHSQMPELKHESFAIIGYHRDRKVYTMFSIDNQGCEMEYFEGKRKGKGALVLKDPAGFLQVTMTPTKKGKSNTEIVILAGDEPYVLVSTDLVRTEVADEDD
ncbi:MAG: DUF1579 family protein [Planctomycetota bacterium]|nr:DUF1579 family protein [Planctomycetota bacterium]